MTGRAWLIPIVTMWLSLVVFCNMASAECNDTKVRIVFWAPSWFHDGCDQNQLQYALETLAPALYGFNVSEVKTQTDYTDDNTPIQVDDLVDYVGAFGGTKTLYLLGHGQLEGYHAMVFRDYIAAQQAYDEMTDECESSTTMGLSPLKINRHLPSVLPV
ncbi:MAG: hypothetical protein P8181_14710 [bacterium]